MPQINFANHESAMGRNGEPAKRQGRRRSDSPFLRFSVSVLSLALLAFTAACGSSTPNPDATFNAEGQRHPADWMPHRHKEAAQANQASCKECHGSDLLGGISRVSCTTCHLGGVAAVHPADWADEKIWGQHAAYVKGIGNSQCANAACHGAQLEGVEHATACDSCHLDGVSSFHVQAWGDNDAIQHAAYTLSNGGSKCANAACHGSSLTGVTGSGPACTQCHSVPPHEVTVQRTAGCSTCHPDIQKNGKAERETQKLFHTWVSATSAPTASLHAVNADTEAKRVSCAVAACHGTALKGGINANCPSCESCHLGGIAGVHPAEWGVATIQEHQTFVNANGTSGCANAACHGSDLLGGRSSAPTCTLCHVGGVVTIQKHEFAATATETVVNHKSFVAQNGTSTCAITACHGADLTGAGNAPNCVTKCHLGDATTKHPASFGTTTTSVALNHKAFVDANGSTGCATNYCHGSSLDGASPAIGPSCSTTSCHQRIPTGSQATGCKSCHGGGLTSGPTGTAIPDTEGAHVDHSNVLSGLTPTVFSTLCEICHSGAGSGTSSHFNSTANVQIVSTFSSSFGTNAPVRNANGTCSNISCHGGETPAWLTGSIDLNATAGCKSCHALGTAEYNSYSSGRHESHTITHFGGIGCTVCHDSTKLAAQNHLATLNISTTRNGNASATIQDSIGYAGGSCATPGCHGTRAW